MEKDIERAKMWARWDMMQPERLGPYRIVQTLGRGGMGTVYQGVHVETDITAAVKVLSASLAEEEGFRHRFEAEIETLRKLRHPKIVRLFGFGEQNGLLYYVMELVSGRSLEQELRDGCRFSWREVTQIGIDVCQALRHAHDRGVIHRDIKPANLLMNSDGDIRLSDFGIARLFGYHRSTGAGNVLGTIEYMAPEQADAKPVGVQADLYSLGGVMYALLTGRPPLQAKSLVEMLEKQRSIVPDPVSKHGVDIPGEMEHILKQLLEKNPDRRIPTAWSLACRLEVMLEDLSVSEEARIPLSDTEEDFVLEEPQQTDSDDAIAEMPPTRVLDDPEASLPVKQRPIPPIEESQEHSKAKGNHAKENPSCVDSDPSVESNRSEPSETSKHSVLVEKPQDHFTFVDEADLDQFELEDSERKSHISPQTWVLMIALVAVGIAVWYLLQPPRADDLYDRIMKTTASRSITSFRQAEDDIQQFLIRYSNDSRSESLRELMQEIELDRLENRMELRRKGLVSTGRLLPIERDYLEAINYAELDIEKGMIRLESLIDLYNHRSDISGPTGQCLELARRRLLRIRQLAEQTVKSRVALINERLNVADQIEATEPKRARQMREAVIELYDEKPWAVEVVDRARDALDRK